MMKLELYTDAALTVDLPEYRLCRGDIVKLLDHHVALDGTEGYSIEVFNAVGETMTVTAVPVSALEALRQDEVLSARTVGLVTDYEHIDAGILSEAKDLAVANSP